jgi:predicted metal-dependent enzyme (double-stranded beta helix superfamily)
VTSLIERLRSAPRDAARLPDWLAALRIDPDEIAELRVADASHPYGRRVVVEEADLEAMIATWTPGARCAPHDHGGAVGAVRVLVGACVHTCYAPEDHVLRPVLTERRVAGDVLCATSDLVHAMQDVGDEPLVTLHVYVPGIPRMVVYDEAGARTLVVRGGCGAWMPDHPADVLRSLPGFQPPDAV